MLIADDLEDQGVRPTVARVKKRVGERGSYQQVAKYMRLWHKARQESVRPSKLISSHDQLEYDHNKAQQSMERRAEELQQSLALVRATLESTVDGILIVSRDGKLVDWNKRLIEIMHVPEHVLTSRDEEGGIQQLLEQVKNPQELYQEIMYYLRNPDVKGNLGELHFKDGRVIERYSQPHVVNGQIIGRVWSFRDITERKKNEQRLMLQSRAIEASPNGIFIIDVTQPHKPVNYINPAFVNITGYRAEEVINQPCPLFDSKKVDASEIRTINDAMEQNNSEKAVVYNYRKSGEPYWSELQVAPVFCPGDGVNYFVGIVVDITTRVEMERQLEHQATHDSLTNLPNRALLWDRLKQAILYAKRRDWKIGILFIDLDRFKIVNDSMGHLMGDEILNETAKRLLNTVRDSDTVARIGGDEYVIVIPQIQYEKDVVTIALKCLAQINKPYYIRQTTINISCSIGVCYYPKDGRTVETLLKNADMSMYKAKDSGRNNFQFYSSIWNKQLQRRMKVENYLLSALDNDEMTLNYQPFYSVHQNRFIGCEALLRWNNSDLGYVSPAEFIPIAEENGFIHKLGHWVLETVCRNCKYYEQQGYEDFYFTVNMSAEELKRDDIVETVRDTIQKTGVNPSRIQIEITENIVMSEIESFITKMKQMRQIGLKLAIDDFGKEYSSLSYLLQMPVDCLKIDISFTSAVLTSESGQSIIKTIMSLGESLGLQVVVEGVEFEQQYQFFVSHEFDVLQGFYLARPMPFDDLAHFLSAYTSRGDTN